MSLQSMNSHITTLAQANSSPLHVDTGSFSQFGFTSLNQAVGTLLPFIFLIAGVLAFFYMMMAAFKFLTSGGSDEGAKAARTTFRNVIIGLFLLAMLFVFWKFIVALIPGMDQFFSL